MDLILYWFFSAFLTAPNKEDSLLSDTRTITSCWTWYGALLSDTKTISSCWTWYATDVSFPFLSHHYQCHQIIRIWNNIKLLDLVCYWYLFSFFFHPTIRVALLLEFETISSCWNWHGTAFFCTFNLTEQWESPCYQTLKQYQVAGLGTLLILIFFLSPHYQSRRVIRIWNNIRLLD